MKTYIGGEKNSDSSVVDFFPVLLLKCILGVLKNILSLFQIVLIQMLECKKLN